MIKVLAISRVVINSEYVLRFLCIDDNSGIDIYKTRYIMMNTPYPCYDVYSISSRLDKQYLVHLDYKLDNINAFYEVPLSNNDTSVSIKHLRSIEKVNDLLCKYNPFNYDSNVTKLLKDVSHFSCGWLVLGNSLSCIWRPSFRDSNISKHFSMQNDILVYKFEKDVYLLTGNNVRHKPAKLGEVLTINLQSLHCVREIKKVTKDNNYIESVECFDRCLRDWVIIDKSEPIVILGRKDR